MNAKRPKNTKKDENNDSLKTQKGKEDIKLKIDVKNTLLMGFGFFSCMVAWSFYNFKVPIILNGITGLESGEWNRVGMLGSGSFMEVIGGALMTLDNIIAILLQPYFGQLSDRMRSKYGRRKPFVMIGIPVAVFCLFILPFSGVVGLFIGIIVVFNLAMAFYRPPVMSVLPDKTPPSILSRSNSYISLMGGFGVVVGMLIPSMAEAMPHSTPVETGVYATQDFFWVDFWGFFFTGIIMLISLLLFIRNVEEVKTGKNFWEIAESPIEIDIYSQEIISNGTMPSDKPETQKNQKKGFFDDWHKILKDEDKSALYILLAVFFYLFGFNALEFSFGRYATSYFQIEEGTAGLLLAIMPVMLIITAIPAGSLAEKYGRLKIMKVGLVITALCTVGIIIVAPLTRSILETRTITFIDLLPIMLLLSIAGIGYGFTHINALPVVWQLSPKNKVGAYTGVYYMVSALGSIISPLIMSSIYWIIREVGGNQWNALFPYYLMGLILGYFFVSKTKHGDAVPLSGEELAELKTRFAQED